MTIVHTRSEFRHGCKYSESTAPRIGRPCPSVAELRRDTPSVRMPSPCASSLSRRASSRVHTELCCLYCPPSMYTSADPSRAASKRKFAHTAAAKPQRHSDHGSPALSPTTLGPHQSRNALSPGARRRYARPRFIAQGTCSAAIFRHSLHRTALRRHSGTGLTAASNPLTFVPVRLRHG